MIEQQWRSEAMTRFPAFAEMVNRAENPYQLWIDLEFEFECAYDKGQEELIRAIYEFAWWCCDQPRGQSAADDLPTCVAVSFFEHIPTHAGALRDMPRWWSLEQVKSMKEVFSYLVGEEGYARVLAEYDAQPGA